MWPSLAIRSRRVGEGVGFHFHPPEAKLRPHFHRDPIFLIQAHFIEDFS